MLQLNMLQCEWYQFTPVLVNDVVVI